MSKGSRSWCYTVNNFTEEDRDGLRALTCAYNVFGYERGDEGTPHLQGYIHFKDCKTLSAVKKVMPRAHLEPRKGTVDQAVEYCKKEGDFEEFGIKPMSQTEKGAANKRRYEEALQMAKEGRFDDIPGDLLTRHYTTYKKIRADYIPKPQTLSTTSTTSGVTDRQVPASHVQHMKCTRTRTLRKLTPSGGMATLIKISL